MPKPEKNYFHSEHHSRNLGLISKNDQQKIDQTTLLIVGCGVGSQVAYTAVRMGFENLILVDGDKVELSNINRQGYGWKDVGKFKVDALAKRLRAINPHLKIKKYPLFIDPENAEGMVKRADIIIDTIDPDASQALIAMHRMAKKHNKYIIQPCDVGWGAIAYIFSPNGLSYEELIGFDSKLPINKINSELAFLKFVEHFVKIMPPYVQKLAMEVAEGKRDHYPQPVTAAYILSAITVVAAKRIALGLPVKLAPDFIYFDPNIALDPNANYK